MVYYCKKCDNYWLDENNITNCPICNEPVEIIANEQISSDNLIDDIGCFETSLFENEGNNIIENNFDVVNVRDDSETTEYVAEEHNEVGTSTSSRKLFNSKWAIISAIVIICSLLICLFISSKLNSAGFLSTDDVVAASTSENSNETIFFESFEDNSNWSDWQMELPDKITEDEYLIEKRIWYRAKKREISTGQFADKPGWVLLSEDSKDDGFGEWSDWSTESMSSTDKIKVEKKTQYRSRQIIETQNYTDWSDWSDWSADYTESNDLRKVEIRVSYRYYYFYCPVCGGREPFTGRSDCQKYTIQLSDAHIGWFPTPYSQCNSQSFSYTNTKKYTQSLGDSQIWIFSAGNINDTAPGTKDAAGPDEEVIRNEYRYCTREVTYDTSYGEWDKWSDAQKEANSQQQVEQREVYRFCERTSSDTYTFYRWGDWSEFTLEEIEEGENTKVETKTEYRFKLKPNIDSVENRSFIAVICYSSTNYNVVLNEVEKLKQEGFDAQVIKSSQWGNFNPDENLYLAIAQCCETNKEAEQVLSQVRPLYSDAYIKSSGSWIG